MHQLRAAFLIGLSTSIIHDHAEEWLKSFHNKKKPCKVISNMYVSDDDDDMFDCYVRGNVRRR